MTETAHEPTHVERHVERLENELKAARQVLFDTGAAHRVELDTLKAEHKSRVKRLYDFRGPWEGDGYEHCKVYHHPLVNNVDEVYCGHCGKRGFAIRRDGERVGYFLMMRDDCDSTPFGPVAVVDAGSYRISEVSIVEGKQWLETHGSPFRGPRLEGP